MSDDNTKPQWAMSRREKENAARAAEGKKPRRGRGWIVWLALALVLAGGGVWAVQSGKLAAFEASRAEAEAAKQAEAEARARRAALIQIAPFEVVTIAPATLTDTLKITGSLAPVRQLHLSAEVTARVADISVRPGDTVKTGDVLVSFDTEALDSQLTQAMATAEATRVQLDQARTDFERTRDLVERGIAPPNTLTKARSALDQLTATYAAQQAQVANARRAREKARVTAPFDGVISRRSVDPGTFVATGSPLVTLVDLSRLEVEATAPVAAAPKLQPGQDVDLRIEGFGARQFHGKVARLAPVAAEGSRMLPVYVSLDNPGGELRGGMFASGRIVLEARENALGVPAGALRRGADGPYVLVIEGGKAVRRAVTVAREWDSGAVLEIATGLAPGDVVVSAPLAELRPGDTVELLAAEAGQ